MRPLSQLPFVKILTLLLLPHILLGQDDDQSSGGSESAAEASVSGSASKKAIGAPESSESSPAINVAKAGLSVSKILTISTDKLRAVTQSGSTTELKSLVTSINAGAADLSVVADIAVSAKASGGKVKLTEIKDRAEIVQVYVKSGLSGDELAAKIAELKNPTVKFVKSEAQEEANVVTKSGSTSSLAFYNSLKDAGLTKSEINIVVDAYKSVLPKKEDALKTFTDKVLKAITGKNSLLSKVTVGAYDKTIDESVGLELKEVVSFHPDILSYFTSIDDVDTRIGLFYHYYSTSSTDDDEVPEEIKSLAKLANLIFNDRDFSNKSLSDFTSIDLEYISSANAPRRLLNYLAQYNILGFNDEKLISELPTNLFDTDNEGNSVYANSDITEFAKYLATYTNERDLGDNDLSEYKIPLGNIELYPAKNISLSGELDVSKVLPKATLSNNNVEPEDIRIAIIGAANDVTITDNLLIKNDNKVEDHALVIAAADDLVVTKGKSIKYQGSNLALASGDTMWLVDVDIEAGGNIAIGTLNDLHLTSGTEINAGDPDTANKDLVLLYANDYLNIDNVVFHEGIREIHLDAQRVAMRNMDLGNKFIRINTGSDIKWIIDGAFEINADSLITSDTVTSLTPGKKSVRLEKITHDLVAGGSRPVTNSDFSKVLPTN